MFLGGIGGMMLIEYPQDILLTSCGYSINILLGILRTLSQLQRFDKTNSEVKTYALEKDENLFEALGKLS